MRSVSSAVHLALLNLLNGNTVPKKERSPNVIAAYRIQRRRIASCKMAMNPLSGQIEERVIIDTDSGEDGNSLEANT